MSMRLRRRLAWVAALSAIAACQAPALSVESAALLSDPTPQCHTQLERAAGTLAGAPVTLDAEAFCHDATLSIEKRQPRDAAGRRLDGRTLGRPQRLRLLRDGDACVLAQEGKPERITLDACRCWNAPPAGQ